MGLRGWVVQLSWFITYAVLFFVVTVGVTLVLSSEIFPKSDASLVFLHFYLYGLSQVGGNRLCLNERCSACHTHRHTHLHPDHISPSTFHLSPSSFSLLFCTTDLHTRLATFFFYRSPSDSFWPPSSHDLNLPPSSPPSPSLRVSFQGTHIPIYK